MISSGMQAGSRQTGRAMEPTGGRRPAVARWFSVFGRLVLGAVFIWAGVVKVLGPMELLVSIYGYGIRLPEPLVRSCAVILPWVEILAGLSVLTGVWRKAGLVLTACLLVVFIFMTGQAWARGLDISCGCFGSALETQTFLGSVQFAFFRNLLLLALTGWLLFEGQRDVRQER